MPKPKTPSTLRGPSLSPALRPSMGQARTKQTARTRSDFGPVPVRTRSAATRIPRVTKK
jgi:hypothetical protein